jgi:hypothetical protein
LSYEQLMQHAHDIQQKAISKAIEDLGGRKNSRSYMAEMRPKIEQEFADIPDRFQPFAEMPTPTSFDSAINEMAAVLTKLCSGQQNKDPIDGDLILASPVLDKMSGSESYIENWSGRAAMDFKSKFIDPFPSIVRNQFTMAAVLKAAMEANKAMWAKTRNDIDQIAHKTLEALDHMDDCGSNQWNITFTVVASIAAVGAVAFPPAELALTVVGAAASVAGAAAPDDPPSNSFSGESAEAVISSMRDAITKLTQEIGNVEHKISGALDNVHRVLTGNRSLFVSPRPALADATPGDIKSPAYMGDAN